MSFVAFYPPLPGSSGAASHVIVDSSALPAGASTSANQATANTSLASIDTKTPILGQALAGASVPVVLPTTQITALTPPTTVTVIQPTGTNLHTVVDSGSVSVSNFPATQPISGTVTANAGTGTFAVSAASLPLPTGASTETTLAALNTKVTAVNTGAVVVSSSALPTGASTEATLSTLNGKVTACNTGAVVLTTSAATIGALVANQSVNNTQIAGNTVSVSNGTVDSGVQRVAIASDNSAFTVNSQSIGTSSATNACSSVASTALEASHVIKASAGRLYQLTGVNTKATAQYIQVFNSATVPADTAVPVLLAYVQGGGNFSWDFNCLGHLFTTGITVSNSSTAATKTIGAADCWFNAEYV